MVVAMDHLQWADAVSTCAGWPVQNTRVLGLLRTTLPVVVWKTDTPGRGKGWSVSASHVMVADNSSSASAICGGGVLSANTCRLVDSVNGDVANCYHGGSAIHLKINKFDVPVMTAHSLSRLSGPNTR
jgi:hypothetical protein